MSNNHTIVVTPGTGEATLEIMNMELASVIGEYLHRRYPGYLWRVNAEIDQGIVNILCADVSMSKGCTLFCHQLINQGDAEALVMRAGGELLERAGLHRGRMREQEIVGAKRDLRGDIITAD